MSQTEIDWLNDYHKEVHTMLAPILKAEDLQWLKKSTQKVA
jgi:Xaa-Pro aminopeptidase